MLQFMADSAHWLTVVFARWIDLSCRMGLDRNPSFFCVAIPHDASPQLHVWHEATLDGKGWKKTNKQTNRIWTFLDRGSNTFSTQRYLALLCSRNEKEFPHSHVQHEDGVRRSGVCLWCGQTRRAVI